jgi:hypothetical protein
MSDFQPPEGETEVIRPSVLHNGFLAFGCVLAAAIMFKLDPAKVQGSMYMGGFLFFGALIIMTPHLPGSTGIWIDRDGFLVRDMYKSERYRWDEVGRFIVNRKIFGKGIEFAYQPPDGGLPQVRQLPRSLGGAPQHVAKRMNDWHGWAGGGFSD